MYRSVRNVCFSENYADVLNGSSLTMLHWKKSKQSYPFSKLVTSHFCWIEVLDERYDSMQSNCEILQYFICPEALYTYSTEKNTLALLITRRVLKMMDVQQISEIIFHIPRALLSVMDLMKISFFFGFLRFFFSFFDVFHLLRLSWCYYNTRSFVIYPLFLSVFHCCVRFLF